MTPPLPAFPAITALEQALTPHLQWRFVRASGPGGQHVNKVNTAVQLRFDVEGCALLPDDIKARLIRLAGFRMTGEGVLVIDARRHRLQERNRAEALERLRDLIEQARIRPKPRRATRPSRAAKTRRLEEKKRRGRVKSNRRVRGTLLDS